MKKSSLTATSLRSLLFFLMVLTVGGVVAGFYFGLERVKEHAVEVSHTVADADASGKRVDELQRLKVALAQSESLVEKANKIFTTEDQYQSQALKDVQKYANDTGITISNTTFDTGTVTPDESDPTQPTSSSHSIVLTLDSPVSYAKLIQFLTLVEGNLPKMQVTSIDLQRPGSVSGDNVTTDTITIAISAR